MNETLNYYSTDAVRLVKIVNKGKWHYSELYHGDKWEIPSGGFIVKGYLEAEHFLGNPKPPAVFLGNGDLAPGSPPPKSLAIEELSEEEKQKYDPRAKVRAVEQKEKVEKAVGASCMICGGVFQNTKAMRIHVTKMHPDYEPVSKEKNDTGAGA